jgi:hypothetical protein
VPLRIVYDSPSLGLWATVWWWIDLLFAVLGTFTPSAEPLYLSPSISW